MKAKPAPGLLDALRLRGLSSCVASATGVVPTSALFSMFMGGSSVREVSSWYGVTVGNVEHALRFEFSLRRRHAWAVRWVKSKGRRA